MPKIDRFRVLYVLKYLWEHTDEEHPVTLAQIQIHLSEQGIEAMVMRLTCIHPLHAENLISKLSDIKQVFVAEEIAGNCGIREHIACLLNEQDSYYTVSGIDLGNRYIQHGAVDKLYDYYGLSPEKLAKSIMEVHRSEN